MHQSESHLCKRRLWSAFILFTATLIASCSIMGGSGQLQRARSYHLSAPKTWKEIKRNESDHAYQTGLGNAVTVTSSCNRHTDASLEVLTRHLLIGTRKADVTAQEHLKVGSHEGLLTKAKAVIEGTTLYLSFFVLKSGDCIFDFSLIGKKDFSENEHQDFLNFAGSLNHS